ncbi:MAG: hypothetical protein ACRDQF_00105 [Thermocrispum sp.]
MTDAATGEGFARTDDDRTLDNAVPLVVVWCCSVGATWTMELHEPDRRAARAQIVAQISSRVPITEPEPDVAQARELLGGRGFRPFPDPSAGPVRRHRHGIGYTRGVAGPPTNRRSFS